MPLTHADGAGPMHHLEPDLQAGAHAIGMAVAARLGALAPAVRPVTPSGAEPAFVIEQIVLVPADSDDPLTLAACVVAHDTYVGARGRPAGVSPGALALARVLVWVTRTEMLGGRPDVRWLGPPTKRPDGVHGHDVTASVLLVNGDERARAAALAVVALA